MLVAIFLGVCALTAEADNDSCGRHGGKEVTLSQAVSLPFERMTRFRVRYDAASLWTSYALTIKYQAGAQENQLISASIKYTSFASKKSVSETNIDGESVLLLFGSEFVGEAQFGCLEIRAYNRSVPNAKLEASLQQLTFTWTSSIVLCLATSAIALVTATMIASMYFANNYLRHAVSAFASSWNLFRALAVVGLVEVFGSLPGLVTAIDIYVNQFLGGNQDVCNFDFRAFFVYDKLPALNAIISHFPYYAAAFLLYAVVEMQARALKTSKEDNKVWHHQLGRILAISMFFLGVRSLGYHICPGWPTIPLDYSGSSSYALIALFLLYAQRDVIDLSLPAIEMTLVTLTVLAYVGTVYAETSWLAVVYGLFVGYACSTQIKPLYKWVYDGMIPRFNRTQYAVRYSPATQIVASLSEMVLSVSNLAYWYYEYYSGAIVFVQSLQSTVFYLSLSAMAVDFVVRLRYKQASIPICIAAFTFMAFIRAAFYFFDLPNSSGGSLPWESRDAGPPSIVGVFQAHDVWHILSAVFLCAMGLLVVFFEDAGVASIVSGPSLKGATHSK